MSTSSATSSLGPANPGPSSADPSGDKLRQEKGTLTDWLHQELQKTVRQIQLLEATTSLAWWWCSLIGVLVAAIILDHWIWTLPTFARYLFWLILVSTSIYWLVRHILPLILYKIHPLYAAKVVEQSLPELKNRLISWWELKHQPQSAPRGVVAAVGRQAVAQLREHDAAALIDSRPMLISIAVAILCTVFLSLYSLCAPRSAWVTTERVLFPWRTIAAPARVRIQYVSPGSAVIPQSLPCTIEVKVNGLRSDEKVTVRYTSRDQQILDQRLELTADVAGSSYQGLLTTDGRGVQQDVEYWVEAGDAVAGPFSLTVTPLPQLSIQKIKLTYPAYTKLPPSEQLSDGSIEAIEGTEVELTSALNGKATKSYVEFHSLSPDNRPQRTLRTLTLEQQENGLTGKFLLRLNSQRENPTTECYTLRAVDPAGNAAPDPIVYPLRVIGDYAPEIRMTAGEQKTIQSSPRGSITIEIDARDPDFGLANVDLEIAKGNLVLETLSLLEQADGIREPWAKKFQVRLSKWRLQAGEKIILTAIAKDNRTQPGSNQPEPNVTRSPSIEIEIIDTPEKEPLQNSAGDNSDQAIEEIKPNEDNSSSSEKTGDSTNSTDAKSDNKNNSQGGGGSGSGTGSSNSQDQNMPNDGSNSGQGESNSSNSNEDMPGSGNASSESSKEGSSNNSTGESADNNPPSESSAAEMNEDNENKPTGQSENRTNEANDSRSPSDNSSQPSAGDNSSNSNQQPKENGSQNSSGNRNPNNSTDSSAARTPDHDGEIMERLQQRLQQEQASQGENSPANSGRNSEQNPKGQSDSSDPADNPAKSGDQQAENGQQPNDPNSTNSPKSNNSNNDGSKGENNSKQPMQNSSNPEEQGGNSQSEAGDPGKPSAENKNSNQQPTPSGADNASGMSDKPEDGKSDSASAPQNNGSKSDTKPAQPKNDGTGQNQGEKGEPSTNTSAQDNSSNGSKSGDPAEKGNQANSKSGEDQNTGQSSADSEPSKSNDNSSMSGETKSNDATGNQQNSKDPGNPNEQGNNPQGDSSQNNSADGNSKTGKEGTNPGKSSQGKPGDQSNPGNSDQSSSSDAAQNSGTNNSAASNQGKQAGNNAGSQPAGNQTNAAETGREGNMPGDNSQGSNPNEASEQANLEYTKQATNMALEYLERQKDQPDPELLKEMNWTKEDLNRFLERWKKTRDAVDGRGNDRETAEKDLRSLGLRPPKSQKTATRGGDDQLRNLQESGQRVAPPKTLKSQFDAVKKALQDRQSSKK